MTAVKKTSPNAKRLPFPKIVPRASPRAQRHVPDTAPALERRTRKHARALPALQLGKRKIKFMTQ